MQEFGKLAAKNFGILLLYVVLFRLMASVKDLETLAMFGSASVILFHSIYLMASSSKDEPGKRNRGAHVLAGLCLLLIGMPTCFAIFVNGLF